MKTLGTMSVKTIPGHRIQPRLPMTFPYLGATILDAGFVQHPSGTWCVEVRATIGLNDTPYFLILSVAQASEADIIERTVPAAYSAFNAAGRRVRVTIPTNEK